MKFLIDNALPPRVANMLLDAGHDAVHVGDYGMAAAEDSAILNRAAAEERVAVSADSDFGMLLAVWSASKPSVILMREDDVTRPRT